jgi:hypothetical protein
MIVQNSTRYGARSHVPPRRRFNQCGATYSQCLTACQASLVRSRSGAGNSLLLPLSFHTFIIESNRIELEADDIVPCRLVLADLPQ